MGELKRILHVDDDDDIRVITKMTLELVGHYEVEQFSSGEDTLAAIDALSPAPQLFLLDVMMPGMSGDELWRHLKEKPALKDIPVIFMTAKTEQAFARGLKEAGATDVILKPFEPAELCQLIETAWAQHQGNRNDG